MGGVKSALLYCLAAGKVAAKPQPLRHRPGAGSFAEPGARARALLSPSVVLMLFHSTRSCCAALLPGLLLTLAGCAPRPWQVAALTPGSATASQPVTSAVPTDSLAERTIRPYRQRVTREMAEVLGTSTVAWSKAANKGPNAPLTRWVAGVLQAEAGRTLGTTPDFAVLTNGSIRAGIPLGPVTVGNVFELMPFENELTVLPVPGPVVQALCDYAIQFDNVAAVGLTWEAGPDKKATAIRLNGLPLDPARTYTLAINDYLANGGDGMSFLRPLLQTPAKKTIRQALLDFLRRERTVKPF